MTTARTFGVVSVNRAALKCGNSVFNKTGFVQGVGMNRHLCIGFFRDG